MSDLKFDQILDEYVRFCNDSGKIDLNLYEEYNVKRGLRDSNGRGVLTGLTEVSDVMGFSVVGWTPCANSWRALFPRI